MKFIKEYDQKEIIIHECSYGPDLSFILDLENVTIKISNNFRHDKTNKNISKYLQEEEIDECFVEIKSKGLSNKFRKKIDKITFNTVFETILNVDFEKIYMENGSGCDGWQLSFDIIQTDGLLKFKKKIDLFSPAEHVDTKETNKLLKIYDSIKEISNYSDYYKLIEDSLKIVRGSLYDFKQNNI